MDFNINLCRILSPHPFFFWPVVEPDSFFINNNIFSSIHRTGGKKKPHAIHCEIWEPSSGFE